MPKSFTSCDSWIVVSLCPVFASCSAFARWQCDAWNSQALNCMLFISTILYIDLGPPVKWRRHLGFLLPLIILYHWHNEWYWRSEWACTCLRGLLWTVTATEHFSEGRHLSHEFPLKGHHWLQLLDFYLWGSHVATPSVYQFASLQGFVVYISSHNLPYDIHL